MQPAQITRDNISDLSIDLSVRGIVEFLKTGLVMHNSHAGVAFVIAHQGEDTAQTVALLGDTRQVYVITINRGTLKRLDVPDVRSYYVDVRDSDGEVVAEARVHNAAPRPITTTGRRTTEQVLASTLVAGDKFCDGTMESGSDAWQIFTADDTTPLEYLPGRLVFKL